MGYTTRFEGRFKFNQPLTVPQFNDLRSFALEKYHGSGPSSYCQWLPSKDGMGLEWDGNEKFYKYVEWLEYLIEKFFKPWGILLNGDVQWRGELFEDVGVISVINNVVSTKELSVINSTSKNELLDRFIALFAVKLKDEIDVSEDEYREGFETACNKTIEQLKSEGLL